MSAASGNRLAASRWQTDTIRLSAVAAREGRTMKIEKSEKTRELTRSGLLKLSLEPV